MTLIKSVKGRLPMNSGAYVNGKIYGKKYRCNLYGCEWESLVENNTTAPATLVNGKVTPNSTKWRLVTGIPDNYGIEDRLDTKVNTAVAQQNEFIAAAKQAQDQTIANRMSQQDITITDAISRQDATIEERMDAQDDAIELLNGSHVEVVADHTAVTNPDPQILYREQGTDSYTDWMYQNGEWKKVATYGLPGLDTEPTPDSPNLITSGNLASAYGSYHDNPEYLQVTTDNEDKIIEGIKSEGIKVINIPTTHNDDVNVNGKVNAETVEVKGTIYIDGATYSLCQSPEWMKVLVDSQERIIAGIRTDGSVYINKIEGLEDQIIVDSSNLKKISVVTCNPGDYSGEGYTRGSDELLLEYRKALSQGSPDLLCVQADTVYVDDNNTITDRFAIFDNYKYYKYYNLSNYNNKRIMSNYLLRNDRHVDYTGITDTYYHKYFLVTDLVIDGRTIAVATVHFEWRDKNVRRQQITQVINYLSTYDKVIVAGDMNPSNRINGERIPDESYFTYTEDNQIWLDAGYIVGNGGKLGIYHTDLTYDESVDGIAPYDNIYIKGGYLMSCKLLLADYMNDHAYFQSDIFI